MNKNLQSKSPNVVVDIAPNGVLLAEMTSHELPRLPLMLPRNSRFGSSQGARQQACQEKHTFSRMLLSGQVDTVIVGNNYDPFHPFDARFELSLKVLEMLAIQPPRRVVLQTRSPLAVLATPLLQALSDKLEIVVALEATSDEENSQLTPETPRVSERLNLIRTLTELKLCVSSRFAPVFDTRLAPAQQIFSRVHNFLHELENSTVEIIPASWVAGGRTLTLNTQQLAVAYRFARRVYRSITTNRTDVVAA